MELIDRYLAAVRSSLPRTGRDDIAAEISAELDAQVEDRESQLGRGLTQDEVAELLKRYGHPRIVASRYWATQHLIGPVLLPFYWNTLKIVLIATALLTLLLAGARGTAAGNPAFEMAAAWSTFWTTLLSAVGAVTIIFAIIEHTAKGSAGHSIGLERWQPRRLPSAAIHSRPRFSPLGAVFELLFNSIALIWLVASARTGKPAFVDMAPGIGASATWPFMFGPVFHTLLNPAIVVIALYIVSIVLFLVRPTLLRVRVLSRIGFNFIFFAVCGFLIYRQDLVTIAHQPDATATLSIILRACIALAGMIALLELYCDLRFLLTQPASHSIPSAPVVI